MNVVQDDAASSVPARPAVIAPPGLIAVPPLPDVVDLTQFEQAAALDKAIISQNGRAVVEVDQFVKLRYDTTRTSVLLNGKTGFSQNEINDVLELLESVAFCFPMIGRTFERLAIG